MPTYEYQCKKCGERLEVFQSFSAKPLRKHDGCNGALEKVFHASGIVFKGSGFYVTDSRGSSSSATSSSTTSSTSSPSPATTPSTSAPSSTGSSSTSGKSSGPAPAKD